MRDSTGSDFFSQTNLAVFLCFSSVNLTIFSLFFGNIRQFFNRDIPKLRKRQGQYPEFGHTQGEIRKKPAKKYISIQGGG